MKAMQQSLNFGKSVSDNGWGMFTRFMQYKLERQGKRLIKVGKWYPSSKTCSACGEKKPNCRYPKGHTYAGYVAIPLTGYKRRYKCQKRNYENIGISVIQTTVGRTGIARCYWRVIGLEREAPAPLGGGSTSPIKVLLFFFAASQ